MWPNEIYVSVEQMIMASLSVHFNVNLPKQRTMLLSHLQMKLYPYEVKAISLLCRNSHILGFL